MSLNYVIFLYHFSGESFILHRKNIWTIIFEKRDISLFRSYFFNALNLKCEIKVKFVLRFICLKQLNENQTDCIDFETRFCCPKSFFENEPTRFKRSEQSVLNATKTMDSNYTNLNLTIDDLRNFVEFHPVKKFNRLT